MLDEFTNFGYIPGIDDALSIIRRPRNFVCVRNSGLQAIRKRIHARQGRIDHHASRGHGYSSDREIFKTAKEVSDGLGYQTILDSKFSDRGSLQEREMGASADDCFRTNGDSNR